MGTKTKKKRKKTKDVQQIEKMNELEVTGPKIEDIPDPEPKAKDIKSELLDSSVTEENVIPQFSDLTNEQTKLEDPDEKTLEVNPEELTQPIAPEPIPRSSVAKEADIVQE